MPGFFSKVKSFFQYKEPKNEELGFELLEEENEGLNADGSRNTLSSDNNQNANSQDGKSQSAANKGQNGQSQGGNGQAAANRNSTENGDNSGKNLKAYTECKGDNQKGKIKSSKPPIKVEEWNERKNEKDDKVQKRFQPSNNADSVSNELCANLAVIKNRFDTARNVDVVIREFKIGRKVRAFMVYIDGMVDKKTLNLAIFRQLMSKDVFEELGEECPADYIIESILTIDKVTKSKEYKAIIQLVLSGYSALFIEGCSDCIVFEVRGYEKRNVEAPKTEAVIVGPQEGFTENLRTNLTLVRRIVKNEKLITEMISIGKTSNTFCAVMYIDGIANQKVVNEVKKRIRNINTGMIMGSGMVEQFIEDNPFMLFPQVLSTERPDRTASFIMEGQVVIIAEGTPFALAVPVTFFRLFHTSEDSFLRWPYGTFLRMIRLFGLFCATLLPGLYTATVLFHPEMLPTELLISIAQSRESVPFPTIIEVLLMEISFELIREGGVRVPIIIGQTLGIVGALILGQAAVTAGLVSPVVVIVVSITALGSFVIPNHSLGLAIRIERFFFIFAGAVMGYYGISLLLFILAVFVCSMKSFGVPFFSPVAPRTRINPDNLIKYPIWTQKNRPDPFNTPNRKRQGKNVTNWSNEKSEENGNRRNNQ